MFSPQTVSLQAAADRVGIGRTLAYQLAHRPDEDGRLWLLEGVRIMQISGRFRVIGRELDEVLGPVEVGV